MPEYSSSVTGLTTTLVLLLLKNQDKKKRKPKVDVLTLPLEESTTNKRTSDTCSLTDT